MDLVKARDLIDLLCGTLAARKSAWSSKEIVETSAEFLGRSGVPNLFWIMPHLKNLMIPFP